MEEAGLRSSDAGLRVLLRWGSFSLLCLAVPILLFLLVFQIALGGVGPHIASFTAAIPEDKIRSDLLVEFPSRMDYAMGTVVLMVVATVALLYASIAFWHRHGRVIGLLVLATSCLTGLAVFAADEHIAAQLEGHDWWAVQAFASLFNAPSDSIGETMRHVAVTAVLDASGDQLPEGQLIDNLLVLAALGGSVGVAGVTALALMFAEIAWRGPSNTGSPEKLRRRWRVFRTILLLSALILTLSVAANHAFYHWPLAFLEPEFAKKYGEVSSAAAGFWGTLYTLILFSAAVPTVIALHLDIDATAREHSKLPARQAKWRKLHDLVLAPREAFSGMVATAAPLLTSPAIDAIRSAVS